MSKQIQFWVTYEVEGFQGVREVGPYPDAFTAASEKRDIEGYMGVTNARVSMREAPQSKPLPCAWRPSDETQSPWDSANED